MLVSALDARRRFFLGIGSIVDRCLDLPPQIRSLRVRPDVPARVPHKSVAEEVKMASNSTVCAPTGENENEGG